MKVSELKELLETCDPNQEAIVKLTFGKESDAINYLSWASAILVTLFLFEAWEMFHGSGNLGRLLLLASVVGWGAKLMGRIEGGVYVERNGGAK